MYNGLSLDPDQLLGAGPVEVTRIDNVRRCGERAGFDAAPVFLNSLGRFAPLLLLLNSVGGKSLRVERRLGGCRGEAGAGCL